MNKDLFEPMKPTGNLELFAKEQQDSGETLGPTQIVPKTNLKLTETVLPAKPLTYPNQAIKGGMKGQTVDGTKATQWRGKR